MVSATRRAMLLAAAALGVASAACGDDLDDRPARWSYISPAIIQPSCATATCHSALTERAGLDLHDTASGYRAIVDRDLVIPGDVNGSYLMMRLRAEGVRRMPPDVPLPNADIALIERWIAAGAAND